MRELSSSRNGAETGTKAVALLHVRLQVDARRVPGRLDPVRVEPPDHSFSISFRGQRDDVHEPGTLVISVVCAGELEARNRAEKLRCARRPRPGSQRISSSFSSWPMPIAARTSSRR